MMVAQVVEDHEMAKEGQEGETIVKMLLIMLEIGAMSSQLQTIGIIRSIQDLSRTHKYLRLLVQIASPPQDHSKRGKTPKQHRLPNTNKPINNLKLLDRIEAPITLIVLSMGQHKMKWCPVNHSRPLFSSFKVLLCLNKPYLRRQWL
jgi:hypothetical protein